MLTTEDREEIKQIVGAMIAESRASTARQHRDGPDMALLESDPFVNVLARAIEVLGTREKASRWLRAPVRSLGDKTPMSLLNSPEGLARVQDTLGQIEHGVW
jgi:putative toxin-antitoxin system antitoxin component (TIGR02293 family)